VGADTIPVDSLRERRHSEPQGDGKGRESQGRMDGQASRFFGIYTNGWRLGVSARLFLREPTVYSCKRWAQVGTAFVKVALRPRKRAPKVWGPYARQPGRKPYQPQFPRSQGRPTGRWWD